MSDDDNRVRLSNEYPFVRKVLITVIITIAVILSVLFIGQAINTLLVIFAGILLGVIFRVAKDFVHEALGINKGISLALVIITFLVAIAGTGYLLIPSITSQADTFYKQIPETWQMTKQEISRWSWGRELANENPQFKDFFEDETDGTGEDYDMTKSILGYLSSIATILAALILVFVISIYIAAQPEFYSGGFVRIFPKSRREEVIDIMNEISLTMQWWMVGQVSSMIILGILATAGLWLIGVPYPLLLGLLTAFMTFIPNLGPIIAGVPILLVALTVGVDTAIYTAIFYVILQCFEGYVITPMIHHQAISVPPVMIITVQFLLYYLVGFLGVLLAMPLMGCMMVLIERLYIQDTLGDTGDDHNNYDLEGDTIIKDG